jgi:hypothetical protein
LLLSPLYRTCQPTSCLLHLFLLRVYIPSSIASLTFSAMSASPHILHFVMFLAGSPLSTYIHLLGYSPRGFSKHNNIFWNINIKKLYMLIIKII